MDDIKAIVSAQGDCGNVGPGSAPKCCPIWANAAKEFDHAFAYCSGEEKDGAETLAGVLRKMTELLCTTNSALAYENPAHADSRCMDDVEAIVSAQGECANILPGSAPKCCPVWANAVKEFEHVVDECSGQEKVGTEDLIKALDRATELLCKGSKKSFFV